MQRLSCAEVSSDGRYIVAVSEQGNLLVFDIETLSQDLNAVSTFMKECNSITDVFEMNILSSL